MEQRHTLIVWGYVRLHHLDGIIDDIINIIYDYYFIALASQILDEKEQFIFMDFLFDQLSAQKENENMKSINTKLLFRASDNGNISCDNFHHCCDNQGATITIIHNESDYIFGGYTSKSWPELNKDTMSWLGSKAVKDPNVFLFTIRPNLKCIPLKSGATYFGSAGDSAITTDEGYGPVFGMGWDLFVRNTNSYDFGVRKGIVASGYSASFEYESDEFFGGKKGEILTVSDFEVFKLTIV